MERLAPQVFFLAIALRLWARVFEYLSQSEGFHLGSNTRARILGLWLAGGMSKEKGRQLTLCGVSAAEWGLDALRVGPSWSVCR
jgi:hypothetical protein